MIHASRQRRRHRLAACLRRIRDVHDAGTGVLLRGLVRAKNVVGTVMQSFIALAVVTITWALIGYSLAFGPDKGGIIGGLDFFGFESRRRRTERLRANGAGDDVHGLPDDVRDHHAGAHRGCVRGADEVLRLPDVHRLCGRSSCTRRSRTGSGVAGSWARWRGGVGLRRRRGRPRERRCRGACYRDLPWPSSGPRGGRHVAPQRAVRDLRRRDPVVRLVRVQCRQRTLLRSARVERAREHAARRGRRGARVDLLGTGAWREGHHGWGRHGGGCRPCDHHAGRGVRSNRWRLSRSVSSRVSCASRRCD